MRIALVIPLLALTVNGQPPGYLISTVAGSGWIGDGGPATLAQTFNIAGVARDAAGNVYFSDEASHTVRKIAAETGIITALAGNGYNGNSGDAGGARTAAAAHCGA